MLILSVLGQFFYSRLALTGISAAVDGGVVGGVLLGSALLLWYFLNKPSIVDFFIATESEMKKVNWTSRKDLMGSTKVVIFFMFLIAAVLFAYDVMFGYAFKLIKVLSQGPFG